MEKKYLVKYHYPTGETENEGVFTKAEFRDYLQRVNEERMEQGELEFYDSEFTFEQLTN